MDRADSMPGAGQVLNILLVEREDADALAIQQGLTDAGVAYTIERARNDREFLALLSTRFDIVIADWHFSARDRMRATDLMRQRDIDVPLIFISDHRGKNTSLLTREPYLIQVLKDISLRKQEEQKQRLAEARLARARRAQQVLLECNRALAYEAREERLLDQICRALVHSGAFLHACIALATDDERQPLVTAARAGLEDAPAALLAHFGAGDAAAQRVVDTSEPNLARYIADEGATPEGALDKHGYQARYVLPLHVDGSCAGALCVYAREPDRFDHDEITLLDMLAKDLAYGMSALRREAARQRAEAQLARVLRARRVMAECNHALVHASDEPSLLREMCRILVESGGYVQAWIGFATGNVKRSVRVGAHAGYGNDQPMNSPSSWDANGHYCGPMGEVIASGKPILLRHALNGAHPSWDRERAQRLGYQSAYLMPLVVEGRVIGAISIHAREPDAFDNEEIRLVTELADDLAYGISALRTRVAREYAERQLRASERRYRETFNQAAVGITRVDLNGVLTDANQKFCDMLGYVPADLVGKLLRDITHPDDAVRSEPARLRAAAHAMRPWSDEQRYVARDGRIVWTRRTSSVARDDQGGPQYLISVVEDITASKALEQRFEATFNQAAVGIMHSSLQRRVMLVNQRLCEMLGYTAEELTDRSEHTLHHPIDAHADETLENKLVAGEIRTFSLEKRYIRKDERVIWCRRTVSLARDADGEPLYFIRVFEDITERKDVEERYRATVQQAPVGIVHTALDGAILQVNPRFCEIVGYAESELLRMSHRQIVHPLDAGREHGTEFQRLLQGKLQSFGSDERLLHKSGAVVWVRRTVSVVRDSARAPLYLIRIVEDITREKETEERYRATVENAPVGIMHTDNNRRVVHVNRKLCEMLGYSESELLGRTAISLVEEIERGHYRARFNELWAGKIESFVSDRPLLRKDGKLLWVRRVVSLVRDSGGNPRYFVHLMEDITETREAEERYRATFDNAPVGILHTGIEDDRILKVNRKLCEILGYTAEELLELRTTDLLDPATRRRDRSQYFMQMLAGKMDSFSSERLFVRKDGTKMWTNRTVSVVRDASGKPLYFLRIIEDISERKRAQQALERTSELNALLQQLATAANEAATPEQAFRACLAHLSAFGGWVLGRVVIFGKTEASYSEQLSIWHGAQERWRRFIDASEPFMPYPKSGLINRVFETREALWVEELPLEPGIFRRAEAARACGLVSAFAFPVIAAGHSYALIELYADRMLARDSALMDAVPNISAQLARVAERHFAENALKESERFARATMDALSQHICVVDEDGTITAVNKSWRRVAEDNGYAPTTVWDNQNFFMAADKATGMSAADVGYVAAGVRDVLSGTQDEFTTEYSCRTNAEQRWYAVKVTRFPAGGPKRAVISFENITERALSHRRRAMEHAVTSVLAESASLSEAMPRLIRTMCEAMEWAYGALWNWDDQSEILRRAD
ncbi:MAG: PAS domain S-box protein, partial [Rhodospirillaceae bacterium]